MHNKYQEEYIVCFLIFGILIAFSVFILRQYFYTSEKALDVINAAILFWTGIVIVIYTREAYKLRATAQRQTELQLRPFVIFEVAHVQNIGYLGKLKNIGNGTALNVNISEDIVVKAIDVDSLIYVDIYKFAYTGIRRIIEARSECPVYADALQTSWAREGYVNQDKLWPLHPELGTSYTTRIEFQNIEMQGYYVEQVTSGEGIYILGCCVLPFLTSM